MLFLQKDKHRENTLQFLTRGYTCINMLYKFFIKRGKTKEDETNPCPCADGAATVPVWAMAGTTYHHLEDYSPTGSDNDIYLLGYNTNQTLQSSDTITGTAAPCRIIRTGTVPQNATLYLQDVNIPEGTLAFEVENNSTVKLILQGNNRLNAKTDFGALQILGSLIMNAEGKKLDIQGINVTNGCDIVLPEYSGSTPAGMRFAGWAVLTHPDGMDENIAIMQAGERITESSGLVQIAPYFELLPVPAPEPDISNLPQTGDQSTPILWSALAVMSAFGMMMLVCKKKEA